MSKGKLGPLSTDRIKSFVERYEKLAEEKHAVSGDMKDVLAEAKGVGYDPKTIKWLVGERKLETSVREERDALRDTYAHALGIAVDLVQVEGLSLRQAAKQTGVSKSSLHRALAVPEVSREMVADDLAYPVVVVACSLGAKLSGEVPTSTVIGAVAAQPRVATPPIEWPEMPEHLRRVQA